MFRWVLFSLLVSPPLGVASAADGPPPVEGQAREEEGFEPLELGPTFAEDDTGPSSWRLGWHGYARMPIGFAERPLGPRGPVLVDDDYDKSGFSYLRINERDWVELDLSAQHEGTRLVAGLFASPLSEWVRESTLVASSPAYAFIEHAWKPADTVALKLRGGVFWRRLGYLEAYDTYLIGRTHASGLALEATLFDTVTVEGGLAGRARTEKKAFSPVSWVVLGYDNRHLALQLYYLDTWSEDEYPSKQNFEVGRFWVMGADLHGRIPGFGKLHYGLAFYQARQAENLHAVEVLHSQDGQAFRKHYLGGQSENGTGEVQANTWDLLWQPARTVRALFSTAGARALLGLDLRFFGMTTWTASPDPDFNDRRSFKWGSGVRYTPAHLWSLGETRPFFGVQYHRVAPDAAFDSSSFRAWVPRLGVSPAPHCEFFVQWAHYTYGKNVNSQHFDQPRLNEEAARNGGGVFVPDQDVFKIQAQLRW